MQQPKAQRETIVADSFTTRLDAYDMTRLLAECAEVPAIGMLMFFGVPMEARMAMVGVRNAVEAQQVREESTTTDLWVLSTMVRVVGERERRGLRGPVGATFTVLELSALVAHLNKVDDPTITAFFKRENLDGAAILKRHADALHELPNVERLMLSAFTAVWVQTDNMDLVRGFLDECIEDGPVAEAIAERRAAGAGHATLH
ncbi:TPA: hypothetical protein ACYLN4_000315 [Burkholderia lata]|uniref:hypothetical protein n=1 Tax=Burkholderia vietnamiensis TaxID=60552 RepID=UPI001B8E2E80|nr:hypothetical protein [Burkholderia vietnamiensis]MBR8082619.1 hypothetical protein [Burkholderia vietnamiensis]